MSLIIPKSTFKSILFLMQEAGSPLLEHMLGCVGTCEDSLPPFAFHYQAQCCSAILS